MAIKTCLGIDLGSSSVKIAELSIEREKVRILNLVSKDLEIPLDASESEREEAKLSALKELRQKFKISTRDAVFSIPGQAVFVRKIKLPATSDDRLARIINYEARQQIPFPIEKTVFEYQIFREEGKPEVDVLLVAIRKDHLQNYMNLVSKSGLKPLGLNVSSFALYNYFAYNPAVLKTEKKGPKKKKSAEAKPKKEKKKGLSLPKPKMKKKKGKKGEEAEPLAEEEAPPEEPIEEEPVEEFEEPMIEEVRGYVNIGAGMLDLAVARVGEHFEMGFTRSVPMAGNEITRVIWDRLNLESIEEAERIKRSQVAVLLGGEEAAEQGINKEASEAAMFIIDRLIGEIKRSLDFYVSQPEGMTVDTLFLCGGQAILPNLAPYMEERLGIPVELCDALSEEAFVLPQEAVENVAAFVSAIGLGLTGLGLGQVQVDFLPAEIKVMREFKSKHLVVGAMAALLLGIILLGTMSGKNYTDVAMRESQMLDAMIRQAEPISEKLQEAKTRREDVAKYIDYLEKIGRENRSYWIDFFVRIKQEMPLGMVIDQIYMGPYGDVVIEGRSETRRAPADLVERLKDIDNIEEPKVDYLAARPELFTDINKSLHKFSISLKCIDKYSSIATPTPTPTATMRGGRGGRGMGYYYGVY